MKYLLHPFAWLTFLILFFTSCTTDPCDGVACDNGVCDAVSGKCICSRGYQIDNSGVCTVMWTTKFAANYNVSDTCTGSNAGLTVYNSTITAIDAQNLSISNFGNTGRSIAIEQNTSATFEIDLTSNDTIFLGSGSLVDTILVINYTINDTTNQRIDACTATFTKL